MPRHHLIFDPALNGARMLLQLRGVFPESESLFNKTPDSHLIAVAPVLFFAGGDWTERLASYGLKPEALVCLHSLEETDALAAHLRQFIYRQQGSRQAYFRFWDARVLQRCLTDWQPAQAVDFFGSIQTIETYPATPDAGGLHHYLREGQVLTEKVSAASGFVPPPPAATARPAQPTSPQPLPSASETHSKPRRTFLT